MSDVFDERKSQSDKIVYGYIRTQVVTHREIPTDIKNLCSKYYHIVELFVNLGNKYIEMSEDGQTVSNNAGEGDTIYGSVDIDCDNDKTCNKTFEWIFKILSNGPYASIGIGTKGLYVNNLLRLKPDTYCLDCDGDVYSGTSMGQSTQGFEKGDTIKMTLNPSEQLLGFYNLNEGEQEICKIHIETKNKTYRMAVYLYRNDSIKLINFSVQY